MSTTSIQPQLEIAERFRTVRRRTQALCGALTPEDMMVQSCPEASPAKWHLAHTAWFFESFILREFLPGYRAFNDDFIWLFNSYYRTFAEFPEKRLRSSFSRPGLEEVLRYREGASGARSYAVPRRSVRRLVLVRGAPAIAVTHLSTRGLELSHSARLRLYVCIDAGISLR